MSEDLEPEVRADAAEFEKIAELSRAFWPSRILLTAVELDLFTTLGGQSLSAAQLASHLDADPRGIELLANALVGLELLTQENGRYANGRLARRFLDGNSPAFRGKVVRLASLLWQRWSRLTSVVREGAEAIGPEWGDEEVRDFTLALQQATPGAGRMLVDTLDLHGVKRIIDLGGGAGKFAVAFAEALPEAQVVLVDLAEVIAVTRSQISPELLDERVVLVEHDFIADGIPLAGDRPGHYDLALLSSVLHVYGPQENATLLSGVYEALEPGGQVVIRDFLVDASGTEPVDAAVFAVNMLTNTKRGRCYSFEQIRAWLHDGGFGEVERRPLDGGIELVTARRA